MLPRTLAALLALPIGVLLDGHEPAARAAGELGLVLDEVALERLLAASPMPPLPASPGNRYADDERAAELGRSLFYDAALSYRGFTSCASCHPPERGFTNGVMDFRGPEAVRRRVPTLWNVAYYPFFGWGGRADSLWAQALGPFEDVTEHDGSRTAFAHHVARTPGLRARYEELFGALPDLSDPERFPETAKPVPYHTGHRHHQAWETMAEEDREAVTGVFVNLGKAVEAFQRRLVTGPAPFDRFVAALERGDAEDARSHLDEQQRAGLELFFGRADCARCHAGPLFTDFGFHDTRVPTVDPHKRDPARALGIEKLLGSPYLRDGSFADVTGPPHELPSPEQVFGHFRTPSLRVLERAGGFFHEGGVGSLEQVVRFYSTHAGARPLAGGEEPELEPLELDEAEIAALAAFLGTLQGPPADPRWARRP